MRKNVALLVGGWSAERQVSLDKGKHVEAALVEAGYNVTVVDVKKDLSYLEAALTPKPDAVFNNLYGRGGEDGTIQGLLEIMEIPYTHSGVKASAIGMDKPLTVKIAQSIGIQCAPHVVTSVEALVKGPAPMPQPYVIKPCCEGSSVGIRIIFEQENQLPLDAENWAFGENLMVEKYIPGKELTVAVLDGKAQGVTEIVSQTRFFDYEAKYHATDTSYILPANIPAVVDETAMENAEKIYREIGCHGLARCDFRYDDSQNNKDGLYLLEINTQPGLTAESIGPSQVVKNGMSFPALCAHLVETAKCHNIEKQKQEPHDQNQPARAVTG